MNNQKKYAYVDNYIVLQRLGDGATAEIHLGYDQETERRVALKILKNNDVNLVEQEVKILKQLSHQNIISVYDVKVESVLVKPNGQKKKITYIALELAQNGELFDFISYTGKFSEKTARYFFKQILSGINYCYKKGVAHRDLKPENILFSNDYKIKLADFGYSRILCGDNNSGKLKTYIGTESYMAPEIHLKIGYNGTSVDLFAASVILFIMCAGNPAFEFATPKDDFYKTLCTNKHKHFWMSHLQNNQFSEEFQNLMNVMLAFDPTQRLSMAEIQQHPWVQGEVPTEEEILDEFQQRKDFIDQQKQNERQMQIEEKRVRDAALQAQVRSQLYNGQQEFRGNPEEDMKNLLTQYKSQKNDMEFLQFDENILAINHQCVNLKPEELFKLLLQTLPLQNDIQKIELDKEAYSLQFQYSTSKIGIDIFLDNQNNKETSIVNFRRAGGCSIKYVKALKAFRKSFDNLLYGENQKEEKIN